MIFPAPMIYFQMTALDHVQLTMVYPHHEGLEYSKKGQHLQTSWSLPAKRSEPSRLTQQSHTVD